MSVLASTRAPRRPATGGSAERPAIEPESTSTRWLEGIECLGVLGFYGWLVARIVANTAAGGGVADLMLLPSEGLVILFMLIRRKSTVLARAAGPWVLAIAATCVPLLVSPVRDRALVPQALGATVLLIGIFFQVIAKLALGRSFGCVAANRGVKRDGPYRVVRHPMYAGYLVSHAAFLALNPTVWNALIYVIAYSLQVPRILAEERLLDADPRYREYRSSVRYRLIPGVF
jgi:protein-S-isoprenylcysteine O-methyltransferase Ste14